MLSFLKFGPEEDDYIGIYLHEVYERHATVDKTYAADRKELSKTEKDLFEKGVIERGGPLEEFINFVFCVGAAESAIAYSQGYEDCIDLLRELRIIR
ncbi:hypothetical protein LJC42_05605 [Eubacteriales bacterium OttesenSCG-928-K08]|nr:hypothetical protein [Eubacteriales bacterium OttesenSCG-928-K08]